MRGLVLAAVLVVGALAQNGPFTEEADCNEACVGSRVANQRTCSRFSPEANGALSNTWSLLLLLLLAHSAWVFRFCPCLAAYHDSSAQCADECDEAHWSLFTYGACVPAADADANGSACQLTCGTRVRVWATVPPSYPLSPGI